jgi:hypothetical protein
VGDVDGDDRDVRLAAEDAIDELGGPPGGGGLVDGHEDDRHV